jgi:hypothetical protein
MSKRNKLVLCFHKRAVLMALYCSIFATFLYPAAQASLDTVMITGEVSCGRCQTIQPPPKGYTRYSWALHSISTGDDLVLVVGDKAYMLQGDKNQLLKYVGHKAIVNGNLSGITLSVQTIASPKKNK